MRKGFTRKPKADEPAPQGKNYITPSGLQRLHDEHRFLLSRERPAVTAVEALAASNGDCRGNAKFQDGKRGLPQSYWPMFFIKKPIKITGVVGPKNSKIG